MEFTIDITAKEARAMRVIAVSQGKTPKELLELLIRRFATEQIMGKYKALFNQMTLNQLEATFGTIEELFPEE